LAQLDHFAETSQFALQLCKVIEWDDLLDPGSGQIGLGALAHESAQGVELERFESLAVHRYELNLITSALV